MFAMFGYHKYLHLKTFFNAPIVVTSPNLQYSSDTPATTP
jgi:hypothetical protein